MIAEKVSIGIFWKPYLWIPKNRTFLYRSWAKIHNSNC